MKITDKMVEAAQAGAMTLCHTEPDGEITHAMLAAAAPLIAQEAAKEIGAPPLQAEYLSRCIISLRDGRLIAAQDQANVAKAIEAQAKEIAELRAALVAIAALDEVSVTDFDQDTHQWRHQKIAREALS